MNRALLLVPVLVAGCLQTGETPNNSEDAQAHVALQKGETADAHGGGGGASSGTNLIDHGGRVLPSSNTYAIWWGTPSAFPSDAQQGIDALFSGMNGTSWLNIAK